MERYEPDVPGIEELDNVKLLEYVVREFRRIALELHGSLTQPIEVFYAPPNKVQDYMIVAADGTSWNPGSGQGIYAYYNGAWHFLG